MKKTLFVCVLSAIACQLEAQQIKTNFVDSLLCSVDNLTKIQNNSWRLLTSNLSANHLLAADDKYAAQVDNFYDSFYIKMPIVTYYVDPYMAFIEHFSCWKMPMKRLDSKNAAVLKQQSALPAFKLPALLSPAPAK